MAFPPLVVALAVRPPLFSDALARVLGDHCTIVVLDGRGSAGRGYDMVLTDRPEVAAAHGDVVIDVSGDDVVLRPPGAGRPTTIGSIADLIGFLGRACPEQRT